MNWKLVISEYGRAYGGSEMQPRLHSEELTFDTLGDVKNWFDILSDRDPDARPHIKAALFQGGRLMFEISRTNGTRQYRWEFVPA